MPEAEEIKLPLDIEDELQKAIDREGTNISINDMKIYFRAAFNNFVVKITVVELIGSLLALIIYNFFQAYIPPAVSYWIGVIFVLILIFLIATVIVRANSGLLRIAKNLVEENAFYALKEKRALAQLESFSIERKTHKDLFESNAYLYGLAIDTNKTVVTIDDHGEATMDTALVINATRRGVKSIERYSYVFFNDFEKDFHLDLPTKRFNLKDKQLVILTPETVSLTTTKVDWLLTANPEFPKDTPIPYEYQTKTLAQVFSMTTEELDKSGNNFEWFSQQISYPTKRLFIQIIFPKNYVPQRTDVAVWNTTFVRHLNRIEYQRILNEPSCWSVTSQRDKISLNLSIEYPITGVHYAIVWMPMLEWQGK